MQIFCFIALEICTTLQNAAHFVGSTVTKQILPLADRLTWPALEGQAQRNRRFRFFLFFVLLLLHISSRSLPRTSRVPLLGGACSASHFTAAGNTARSDRCRALVQSSPAPTSIHAHSSAAAAWPRRLLASHEPATVKVLTALLWHNNARFTGTAKVCRGWRGRLVEHRGCTARDAEAAAQSAGAPSF